MKSIIVIPAILILTTVWLLASLGFWQLDRADEKRELKRNIETAARLPAVLITDPKTLAQKNHRSVLLRGRYDSTKQFIYDNQIKAGVSGYYVLTPFVLNSQADAILVNRGFKPWKGRRDQPFAIKVSESPATIKVNLIRPVERIKLKSSALSAKFPLLLQSLNIQKISDLSHYQIIPMIARLDPSAENGFVREWRVKRTIDKHMGYAVQWFLMALTLFGIGVFLLVRALRKP